jgi:hypothetical protein
MNVRSAGKIQIVFGVLSFILCIGANVFAYGLNFLAYQRVAIVLVVAVAQMIVGYKLMKTKEIIQPKQMIAESNKEWGYYSLIPKPQPAKPAGKSGDPYDEQGPQD